MHEAVRQIPAGHNATVVEIGSWKGRSTIALAKGLRARGGEGRVYAIDPQADERFEEFVANLERTGVRQIVEPVRMMSHDAARELETSEIDVLFIDGFHQYAQVMQDVRDWAPRLRTGAVVGFNDPFWPGVNRALRDEVARTGSPFRAPAFFDNTLFFRYVPAESWRKREDGLTRRLRLFLRLGRVWDIYRGRVEGNPRLPWVVQFILLMPFFAALRWLSPVFLFTSFPSRPSSR